MDVIRLVVVENSQEWDLYYLSKDICATNDHAFVQYKEDIKNKAFGHFLSVEKICRCEKSCVCIPERFEGSDGGKCERSDPVCTTTWWCDSLRLNGHVKIPKLLLHFNGYELSVFLYCLLSSQIFRSNLISYLKSTAFRNVNVIPVKVKLVPPKQHIIDYSWSKKLEQLAYERMVLSETMSWLSTLGGAFSALGDAKTSCAGVAARISVHQFKIAMRLGDLQTVARCKLYLALSLIQRGRLKIARKIIYGQYQIAKSEPEEVKDVRLIRMCQGMWAKLKYTRKLQGKRKYLMSKEP
ncbi:uncharacterized protein LOC124155004 [Ischnura elegans]|uniref:uncharacterized protein LOC124155004 n=1 Tax=Ischnura elegans TaxID=197161 RepID=UPI001ED8B7F7|nr:uncharacterized protein LOC124155004 [Ischnura elegans]